MSESPIADFDAGAVELEQGEFYRVFADERRREVFAVLKFETGPVDLEQLAEVIYRQATELGTERDSDVEDVAIELHHIHLPKLDQTGLLEYDPVKQCVESCSELPA